ncbi:MAG: hypothetical protein QM730_27140 [Anaerolineales bacterium]
MPFNMKKTLWVVHSIIAFLLLSACGSPAPAIETKVDPTATPSQQILKTSMGDFAIVSARLVDEVHDSKAPEGEQFLLIGLAQPDLQKLVPGEFSLETLQDTMLKSQNEIYVLGDDGSQTFYTSMGGWVDDDFVIGFRVPAGGTYTLYWTDNAPIPLKIEK